VPEVPAPEVLQEWLGWPNRVMPHVVDQALGEEPHPVRQFLRADVLEDAGTAHPAPTRATAEHRCLVGLVEVLNHFPPFRRVPGRVDEVPGMWQVGLLGRAPLADLGQLFQLAHLHAREYPTHVEMSLRGGPPGQRPRSQRPQGRTAPEPRGSPAAGESSGVLESLRLSETATLTAPAPVRRRCAVRGKQLCNPGETQTTGGTGKHTDGSGVKVSPDHA
jgi:hypothetical protein